MSDMRHVIIHMKPFDTSKTLNYCDDKLHRQNSNNIIMNDNNNNEFEHFTQMCFQCIDRKQFYSIQKIKNEFILIEISFLFES